MSTLGANPSATSWTHHFDAREKYSSKDNKAYGPFLPGSGFSSSPKSSRHAALVGLGLQTPPADEDMSTTYQPTLAAYNSHAAHGFPSSIGNGSSSKAAAVDTRVSNQNRYHPHLGPSQQPPTSNTDHYLGSKNTTSSSQQLTGIYRSHLDSFTPAAEATMPSQTTSAARRGAETLIHHSLQVPKCISPNGGNLADFAAQMTCLFWFQSIDDLRKAEAIHTIPANAPVPRLPSLAKPYEQFRKWVYNVLSTTQVTQNVILLALLFIYRLKMSTPQIKGRAGSEYRLLTVSLMLGNKFLDDNTYTNKTWAEVSCFAVHEIHVMEVEFLSNMRYNLLASKHEWEHWLTKLACFREYYERALKQPASPLHVSSNANSLQSPNTSPKPAMLPMMPDLPPYTPTTTKTFSPTSSHSQDWATYQSNAMSPLASKPVLRSTTSRKRSPEYDAAAHPAKRQMPPRGAEAPSVDNTSRTSANHDHRPPVPNLSLLTSQTPSQTPYNGPYTGAPTGYQPNQNMSLPPLQQGVRAMSTVYQPDNAGFPQAQPPQQQQQQQQQQQHQQHQPPLSQNMAAVGATAGYSSGVPTMGPSANQGTPTKRRSPVGLVQYASSPMADGFGTGSAMPTPLALTPIANSPSIYLQQRASPYRPIRHVNTLLHPPPTASLDQYHLSLPVPPSHMHYQPLGRRNDVRTGVVPEFVLYNRAQQQQMNPQARYPGGQPGYFGPYSG